MSETFKQRAERWSYGLLGGIIGGGATSVSAWLGMTAAKAIGIDVPTLNWKSVGVIFLSGALSSAVAYLKQSPVPSFDTAPPFKPE